MTRAADVLFAGDGLHLCGHRGHSIDGTENSKTALRAARTHGATLCEIDLRLTADDEFVVYHDPILETASSGTGPIRDQTLSEVKQLRHRSRHLPCSSEAEEGDEIICFAETLDYAAALNLGLIVEIKDRLTDARHINRLVQIVDASPMKDQVLLSSFDHRFLRDLKEAHPQVSTFGIMHTRHVSPVRLAQEAKIDVYSVDYPRFDPADAAALTADGIYVSTFFPRTVVTNHAWDNHMGGLTDTADSIRSGTVAILGMDDVAWGQSFLKDHDLSCRKVSRSDVMA